MNVTNNGYYTAGYLNEVARSRPSRGTSGGDFVPRSISGSDAGSHSRMVAGADPGTSGPQQAPTAAVGVQGDRESLLSQSDPDRLEKGVTPAELYYLEKRPERARPRLKHNYSDYYIQQKQRFDDSEYKPKFYTHKTFRDVFDDDDEPTEKYNPMEFVFDDPEVMREREQSQKVRRAFKSVLKMMGKDYYNDHDYFAPGNDRKTKSRALKASKPEPAPSEVYVANLSDSSDEEGEHSGLRTQVYVSAAEEQQLKKNKGFGKMWKRRFKRAKKDIRKDYEANRTRQEIVTEPEPVQPEPVATSELSNSQAGQNENFHPLWNYVLSWLTYESVNTAMGGENGAATSATAASAARALVPALSPTKNRLKNMRPAFSNIKTNYKDIASKWNQPVSSRHRRIADDNVSSMASTMGTMAPMDSVSDEFVVEVDSDYDEASANTELYYNPVTKQLEHQPPTSASALTAGAAALGRFFLFSTPPKTLEACPTDPAPVQIVSNINGLLKHFKVLRMIFAPIDIVAEYFPHLQTLVILVELAIFMWLLYEVSLLIDALCMMVKAVCAPMIAMGRFMNRIM